jgi:hypothetical protein
MTNQQLSLADPWMCLPVSRILSRLAHRSGFSPASPKGGRWAARGSVTHAGDGTHNPVLGRVKEYDPRFQ